MFTGSRWVGLLVLGLGLQGCLSESSRSSGRPWAVGAVARSLPQKPLHP